MKELLQRLAVFLYHVIEAPESAPETTETAKELIEEVVDAINEWPPYEESDKSPQDE